MKCGYFHTPFVKPGRTGREVFDWSLKLAQITDEAGFSDFLIGEHYTIGWENIPAPDLVIAAAINLTENINFAPMAHLLPYHDPATLAIRIGWLSQVCEGRYFLGIAPGGYTSDAILHGMADVSELRAPFLESIEVMEKVWAGKPFNFTGDYFKAGFPTAEEMMVPGEPIAQNGPYGGRQNLEIAVTALSAKSPSMQFAGERDYSPISFFGGMEQMKTQWSIWSEAMEAKGRKPEKSRFRIARDIFVAETDAEAKRHAINGGLGAATNYLLPVYKKFGLLKNIAIDSGTGIHEDDIDLNFMADHVWLCGSTETVTEKIQEMYDENGGFGEIVAQSFDYMDNPEPYFESLQRLAKDVVPNIK